jgi:hypothetical protein
MAEFWSIRDSQRTQSKSCCIASINTALFVHICTCKSFSHAKSCKSFHYCKKEGVATKLFFLIGYTNSTVNIKHTSKTVCFTTTPSALDTASVTSTSSKDRNDIMCVIISAGRFIKEIEGRILGAVPLLLLSVLAPLSLHFSASFGLAVYLDTTFVRFEERRGLVTLLSAPINPLFPILLYIPYIVPNRGGLTAAVTTKRRETPCDVIM